MNNTSGFFLTKWFSKLQHMALEKEAEQAIDELSGTVIHGQRINVEVKTCITLNKYSFLSRVQSYRNETLPKYLVLSTALITKKDTLKSALKNCFHSYSSCKASDLNIHLPCSKTYLPCMFYDNVFSRLTNKGEMHLVFRTIIIRILY